jgi:hypothetical protein
MDSRCCHGSDDFPYRKTQDAHSLTKSNICRLWSIVQPRIIKQICSHQIGCKLDLHLGPWTSYLQQDYDEELEYRYYSMGNTKDNPNPIMDNPAGCPSISVLLTEYSTNNLSYDNVSALLCSQKIEKVKVNVTYLGHDLMYPSINTNIEPVVISGATEYLTNDTKGVDSFSYRVQVYLLNLTRFDTEFESGYPPAQTLDNFLNHLMHGLTGTTGEDLAGKANRGRFKEAVNNLYARYMTFVIDQRFRHPISQNSTDENNLATGTAYRYTSRLQTNFASKFTLQIMLATMTVLGASAFWLTDLRGTLPRKPTTIASTLAQTCVTRRSPSFLVKPYGSTVKSSIRRLMAGYLVWAGGQRHGGVLVLCRMTRMRRVEMLCWRLRMWRRGGLVLMLELLNN